MERLLSLHVAEKLAEEILFGKLKQGGRSLVSIDDDGKIVIDMVKESENQNSIMKILF